LPDRRRVDRLDATNVPARNGAPSEASTAPQPRPRSRSRSRARRRLRACTVLERRSRARRETFTAEIESQQRLGGKLRPDHSLSTDRSAVQALGEWPSPALSGDAPTQGRVARRRQPHRRPSMIWNTPRRRRANFAYGSGVGRRPIGVSAVDGKPVAAQRSNSSAPRARARRHGLAGRRFGR